jgi:hypothetical protein
MYNICLPSVSLNKNYDELPWSKLVFPCQDVGHLGKEARLMNSIAFIRGRTVKNHHA